MGIQPLRGFPRLLTHALLKAVFFYKTRLAADAKVSAYEPRRILTREEYRAMDRVAAERADELDWHKGGKAAIGLTGTPRGACPVMHHAPPAVPHGGASGQTRSGP